MSLDDTIEKLDLTLKRLALSGGYGFDSHEVAMEAGLDLRVVNNTLWLMFTRGLCRRTALGKWRPGRPPPGGALGRMLRAVRVANSDVTFGQLADLAKVDRSKVRPLLDELVAKEHMRPTTDGWYEVLG